MYRIAILKNCPETYLRIPFFELEKKKLPIEKLRQWQFRCTDEEIPLTLSSTISQLSSSPPPPDRLSNNNNVYLMKFMRLKF